MKAVETWRRLCRAARPEISPALYRACFAGTLGVELAGDVLVVVAPTRTARDQLRRRFAPLLERLAQQALRRPLTMRFIVSHEIVSGEARTVGAVSASYQVTPLTARPHVAPAAPATPLLHFASLHPRYRFEHFVAGDANRLAFAAASDVASSPGARYNPLFLYGGVGLGKTHLLMAIGHATEALGLRAGYCTAETFANDLVRAIQYHDQEAFRAAYRAIDVLLIDDIQFIGGRERTEEEFFHMFNDLHLAGKQIVLSSDRPPRAIPTLHDRLRSRFEWGLLADIAAPDFALRLAIVTARAGEMAVGFPPNVLEYIARPDATNVRALEGALNRIAAAARVAGERITLALAAATLREFMGDRYRAELTPGLVLELVAKHFRVTAADLLGKSRNRSFVWPRQVAMYVLREETTASLAQIGTELGGRDHTTIMHGCDQVTEALRFDERARHDIDAIRTALRAVS